MDVTHLIPYITGAGGALVILVLAVALLLTGKLVTGREHDRSLETITRLEAIVNQLNTANDTLREATSRAQAQVDRLLDGSALSNTLAQALVSVAQQPRPPDPQRGASGD